MSNVKIKAPYPNHKVTTLLPVPQWLDSQKSEQDFQIKRTRQGRVITHPRTNADRELKLQFILTRQKSLELEALFFSYQSAKFFIELHDGSTWAVSLVDRPYNRTIVGRQTDGRSDTGEETVETTLVFSGTKLS